MHLPASCEELEGEGRDSLFVNEEAKLADLNWGAVRKRPSLEEQRTFWISMRTLRLELASHEVE